MHDVLSTKLHIGRCAKNIDVGFIDEEFYSENVCECATSTSIPYLYGTSIWQFVCVRPTFYTQVSTSTVAQYVYPSQTFKRKFDSPRIW